MGKHSLTKLDSIKKQAMIDALVESLGIASIACRAVGVSRQTHYTWYNKDPEYKEAVDDISDVALDFAESKLHKKIEKGDTIATIFYLKTKGKKRGYIEKQEIEHSGELLTPLKIVKASDYIDDSK